MGPQKRVKATTADQALIPSSPVSAIFRRCPL